MHNPDWLSRFVHYLQVASGSAMPEVSRDRHDFSLGKVDGGSTESSFESHKEHFRLPKLLVGDKKYLNKVGSFIYLRAAFR